MKLYPVMLRLDQKRAIVIGGGSVAARKARDLLECGAIVTVISPESHEAMHELLASYPDRIEILTRNYTQGDLSGAFIVFSATDDEMTNSEVSREAQEKNIIVNTVDDPRNCTFIVPSWFDRNGVIIAVSTSGKSPAYAARLRRDIEGMIPDSIKDTLDALEKTRNLLKNDPEFNILSPHERGHILKRIVADDALLKNLVKCYASDSLKFFINKIRSNKTELSE
jgi:precorrin-2 dehydrogenase/sirohydrochlorin ferrochelatase